MRKLLVHVDGHQPAAKLKTPSTRSTRLAARGAGLLPHRQLLQKQRLEPAAPLHHAPRKKKEKVAAQLAARRHLENIPYHTGSGRVKRDAARPKNIYKLQQTTYWLGEIRGRQEHSGTNFSEDLREKHRFNPSQAFVRCN